MEVQPSTKTGKYLKVILNIMLNLYFVNYKIRYNLHNMCHHNEDHGLDAQWHFFATSHGKGACDGIGGTVKRLITKSSLQGTTITNAYEMFIHAKATIPGIRYAF
jgi:hypothetical protein